MLWPTMESDEQQEGGQQMALKSHRQFRSRHLLLLGTCLEPSLLRRRR
jgi:hypothetical protein